VAHKKAMNPRDSGNEIPRQFREWRFTHYHEQSNSIADDCLKFVRLVADTGVVSYRDPTSCANSGKPFFIRTGWSEMIAVPFNAQSGSGENVRESVAEVAIRKENNAQAARS
jgi:hypothetical protein